MQTVTANSSREFHGEGNAAHTPLVRSCFQLQFHEMAHESATCLFKPEPALLNANTTFYQALEYL